MKEIEIQSGKYKTQLDDEDYEIAKQFVWCAKARSDGRYVYAFRYIRLGPKKYIKQYLHQFIMRPKKGMHIDHIDADGLNNQRSNLRLATQQENSFNMSTQIREGKLCKYKGVTKAALIHHRYHSRKPWRARIRFCGELIELGGFATERQAALAYNEAANELFGEFAKLNEISE